MGLSSSSPWLKYYGDTPASLDYPHLTMYQMVAQAAKRKPNNTAYVFMGKKTSYQEFMQRIEAAAKGLYKMGIRKGDRVTICMANTPQALDCFYALNRIGAIPNMIHPLSAAQEIAFYLNFSQSKAILTLDQFYYKVAEILPQLENECQVLIAKVVDELPAPLNLLYPKGIMLSNLNFNALALQTIAASGFSMEEISEMKMLSVMPVFHGFGLGIGIHTPLVAGGTCILIPQFNVNTYAEVLVKQKPNLIPGVPTLFEALLRAEKLEGEDLSFLKGIFSGGDSLSPELKKKVDAFLKAHGCDQQIREGYGTTECVTASCLTPKDYARAGSIGIPFPDTFYKIVEPGTTNEVEPNVEGEICVSGPTVMIGYMANPGETASTLKRHYDGRIWLHTGDLGHMDQDGFVYFRQRMKRMIITSGYNVYPSQLENIIDGHEKVLLSCVIGVKDPYRVQRVKAYVVPMPGVEPTEELKAELMEYCSKRIAKYAMPREMEFRKELPKTLVGKVAYRVLEEEANAATERA